MLNLKEPVFPATTGPVYMTPSGVRTRVGGIAAAVNSDETIAYDQFQDERSVVGDTLGNVKRKFIDTTVELSGATTNKIIHITAAGSTNKTKLIATQLLVTSAVTSGASPVTFSASYTAGNTGTVCSATTSGVAGTVVNKFANANAEADLITDIDLTLQFVSDGGVFDAGKLRIRIYYEELTSLTA